MRKYLLIFILTVFSLSTPGWVLADFDCNDEIEKIIRCEASTNFIDMYKQFCKSGNAIEPAHLIAYEKVLDAELATNHCLAKIYVHPQFQADFVDD